MVRDVRRIAVPELDAFHEQVDVRTRALRVGTQRGRNVASDFALVQRAAPFLQHLTRPQLVVVLEGRSRFDERGERAWLTPGMIGLSDAARGGTDAFGGRTCRWIVLDWDPGALDLAAAGPIQMGRVDRRDLARLDAAASALGGPRPLLAMTTILDVLRAAGLGFARVSPRDLEDGPATAEDDTIHAAVAAQLSQLDAHPAISDLVGALGANERKLHRKIGAIARRYRFPWAHWRAALHHTRLIQAVRLLAAPGATTELVARATGFRAPAALCHAFDDGGLPSPGALARAARGDALDGWGNFAA